MLATPPKQRDRHASNLVFGRRHDRLLTSVASGDGRRRRGGRARGREPRLVDVGRRDQATLLQQSIDAAWPPGPFDLLVLSEVGYDLSTRRAARRAGRRMSAAAAGATVLAAHWRDAADDYPMSGDNANQVDDATAGLDRIGVTATLMS